MKHNKPFFVIIDGIDGSGKTTIVNYIAKQTGAQPMRAFGQGPIGQAIRTQFLKETNDYSTDVAMNFVLTANLEAIYDHVIPTFRSGQSVILDRFISSTYAYQLSRLDRSHHHAHAQMTYFQFLLEKILSDCPPTLYIWAHASLETIEKRLQARTEPTNHFDLEDATDKLKTMDAFEEFYYRCKINNKVVLNCNQTLDQVLQDVDRLICDFLHSS